MADKSRIKQSLLYLNFHFRNFLIILASLDLSHSYVELNHLILKHGFQFCVQKVLSTLFFISVHGLPINRFSTFQWNVIPFNVVSLLKFGQELL